MLRADVIPKHTDSNGWWHILPKAPPSRALEGAAQARTLVIGAGVCGIAAAFRLGELTPDDEIIVLEAERAGFGASGRNAGFMLNLHSHGPPKELNILRRNMNLWASGLSDLRRRVQEFQLDCQWSEAGRFYGSAGPDGEKHIDEIAKTLDALGLERSWLDRDAMERRTGTRFYNRGLYTPGNALVNPAALMRGCAAHFPINVTLFEETPALTIDRKPRGFTGGFPGGFTGGFPGGFLVKTPKGEVSCERVVLANGVFMGHFGVAKGRYVPMATYASLTAPLADEQLAQFGSAEEFGLLGGSEYGATIRLTQDRRLMVRNYFNHMPNAPMPGARVSGPIAKLHRQAMLARWPDMVDVPFEHSWGGIMAFTGNDGCVFGAVEPGIFAVLTNDVSPMTRGTASGRLLADYMEGVDSKLLDLQLGMAGARRLPPRPFLDIGIAYRRAKLRWAAKQEF
ncbi:MAG: FAD-binding oxidoreductase [Rhodospirillales bacterium]|nr:FAD-binding oxidoreductase [Rhodospirillales bacterium]